VGGDLREEERIGLFGRRCLVEGIEEGIQSPRGIWPRLEVNGLSVLRIGCSIRDTDQESDRRV
jgi:hypothetical protein